MLSQATPPWVQRTHLIPRGFEKTEVSKPPFPHPHITCCMSHSFTCCSLHPPSYTHLTTVPSCVCALTHVILPVSLLGEHAFLVSKTMRSEFSSHQVYRKDIINPDHPSNACRASAAFWGSTFRKLTRNVGYNPQPNSVTTDSLACFPAVNNFQDEFPPYPEEDADGLTAVCTTHLPSSKCPGHSHLALQMSLEIPQGCVVGNTSPYHCFREQELCRVPFFSWAPCQVLYTESNGE